MSACDTCPEPGHCCKRLHLSGGDGIFSFWRHDPMLLALVRCAEEGLPFLPVEEAHCYTEPDGVQYRTFTYTCPLLGPDGRCTDYEHRPELCRSYEPLSDPLCILHPVHGLGEDA